MGEALARQAARGARHKTLFDVLPVQEQDRLEALCDKSSFAPVVSPYAQVTACVEGRRPPAAAALVWRGVDLSGALQTERPPAASRAPPHAPPHTTPSGGEQQLSAPKGARRRQGEGRHVSVVAAGRTAASVTAGKSAGQAPVKVLAVSAESLLKLEQYLLQEEARRLRDEHDRHTFIRVYICTRQAVPAGSWHLASMANISRA